MTAVLFLLSNKVWHRGEIFSQKNPIYSLWFHIEFFWGFTTPRLELQIWLHRSCCNQAGATKNPSAVSIKSQIIPLLITLEELNCAWLHLCRLWEAGVCSWANHTNSSLENNQIWYLIPADGATSNSTKLLIPLARLQGLWHFFGISWDAEQDFNSRNCISFTCSLLRQDPWPVGLTEPVLPEISLFCRFITCPLHKLRTPAGHLMFPGIWNNIQVPWVVCYTHPGIL